MSDSCGYNICDQRNRYGAFYDSGTCDVKYVDFYVEKSDSGISAYACFYRCCKLFFVTIVDFLMAGFVPGLYKSLGLYIPLIVVNCIILGRAESYASKNPVLPSIFDGIGMGLGFTVGLTAIGIVRELLGAGEVFGIRVMPQSYEPLTIFVLAPGAFFVLACLVALQNKVKANLEKKGKKVPVSSGCGEGCSDMCKQRNLRRSSRRKRTTS